MDQEALTELATLTSPEPGLITRLSFSPDSGLLAVMSGYKLQLWDLRRLRQELRDLDLGDGWPDYTPAPQPPPGPLRVEIDLGGIPPQ
jgi:hypothetical protein